jgi:hypothetical protein
MAYALLSFALISYTATRISTASTSQEKSECPKILIECPADLVAQGEPFTVSVKVEGANRQKELTYHWSVANGKIISGQGTASITARTIIRPKATKITVKVCGLKDKCPDTTWCSFEVQY